MRGTPAMKHLFSRSASARFAKFSAFFAAAHGWYGISPPSTTPMPAGIMYLDR